MPRLCIDLGGTSAKFGIVESGIVLSSRSLSVTSDFGLLDLENALVSVLKTYDGPRLDAVCIAVPGVVDPRAGALVAGQGKYNELQGVNLVQWAQNLYRIPAFVENDARAALLGEASHGVAAGKADVVLMVLGTGIGTAAMMSGEILRGAHNHAGILGGHLTVSMSGQICLCGNLGCAEELASTRSLGTLWDLDPGDSRLHPMLIETLVDASATGDSKAVRMLDQFVAVWGATLVSLCHAYDPSVAIISGGVMEADKLLSRIKNYVHTHLWSSSHRPKIVTPKKPQLSVLRGLASLPELTDGPKKVTDARK